MKSGGLARAIRPHQADDCALRNGKRYVLNRRKFTKSLGQVLDFQDHLELSAFRNAGDPPGCCYPRRSFMGQFSIGGSMIGRRQPT